MPSRSTIKLYGVRLAIKVASGREEILKTEDAPNQEHHGRECGHHSHLPNRE